MKRQKQTKHQEIYNKCQVEKIEVPETNQTYYKVKKMKGKTMQKIISETKFKEIETMKFPPWCLDKEMTAALIQLERIENVDELNQLITPMVVVYKHVLSNGYKARPICDNSIGIIDVNNKEKRIKIVDSNDYLSSLFIDQNDNSNHFDYVAVVQGKYCVFLSCNSL